MHDQKKFGFIFKEGASLKKLSEEKEQLALGLAFRFDREAKEPLPCTFARSATKYAA